MKKIIQFLMLFALSFLSLSSFAESDYVYFKVEGRNYIPLEKIFIKKIPNDYNFREEYNVFTAYVSSEKKAELISFIKDEGFNIEATDAEEAFIIHLEDDALEQGIAYVVDTSFFSTSELFMLKKILGNSIKGTSSDRVIIDRGDLSKTKFALEKMGFATTITASHLYIKERESSYLLEYDKEFEKSIQPIVYKYGTKVAKSTGKLRFSIKDSDFKAMEKSIKSSIKFASIEHKAGNRIIVKMSTSQEFEVKIHLPSPTDVFAMINSLPETELYAITGTKELYSDGALCAEFKISTLEATPEELKADILENATKIYPNLKAEDVEILKLK